MTTNPQTDDRREQYAQALRDADTYALIERRDDRYRFADAVIAVADAVIAVADAEQAELRQERDLAIAHDRQPYPTAWAYEQACAALRRKTEAIERVRSVLESEAVVGRSALDYRGLITAALMGDDAAAVSGSGRVADETQAPYPPVVEWRTETQRRDDHWSPWCGGRYELDEARADFAETVATDRGRHAWRLVRATTTYAVEVEQPAVVSQPDGEA